MNLLKEVHDELDEIPIQEIGSELKPGMRRVFFPAETKRYVHVSRGAIIKNTKFGKNHPACLVVDADGKRYAFHAVVLRGPSVLKFSLHEEGIDANAFLVTKAGIEGYIDPTGDQPIPEVEVVNAESGPMQPKRWLARGVVGMALAFSATKLAAWRFLAEVPIASCLLPEPPRR